MTNCNYCNLPRELIINDPVYLIKDAYICTPCVIKYLAAGAFTLNEDPAYPFECTTEDCHDIACPEHSFLDLGSGADHSDTTNPDACLDITCECHMSIDDCLLEPPPGYVWENRDSTYWDDLDREDWDYRRSQDYDEDEGDKDVQAPL